MEMAVSAGGRGAAPRRRHVVGCQSLPAPRRLLRRRLRSRQQDRLKRLGRADVVLVALLVPLDLLVLHAIEPGLRQGGGVPCQSSHLLPPACSLEAILL